DFRQDAKFLVTAILSNEPRSLIDKPILISVRLETRRPIFLDKGAHLANSPLFVHTARRAPVFEPIREQPLRRFGGFAFGPPVNAAVGRQLAAVGNQRKATSHTRDFA